MERCERSLGEQRRRDQPRVVSLLRARPATVTHDRISAGSSALKVVFFSQWQTQTNICVLGRLYKVGIWVGILIPTRSECLFRTGKRDLSGLLNDGVNSLAR